MKYMILFIIIIGYVFGLSGIELVRKMEKRNTPRDIQLDMKMILTNKKGKNRSFSLHSVTKDNGSKQIIWFLSPADNKGISFLKIEHDKKDDEMQMWLPGFKKLKRISVNKRSDSFMGSDMSYEDMSNRKLDEFNFNNLGYKLFNNIPCYLLESTPKQFVKTEYSKHITWIDTTLFIALKEESYDKKNQLLKEKFFSYSRINNYHILTDAQVKNIQKNHSTSLKFINIKLDNGYKDSYFHERYLKRLPK